MSSPAPFVQIIDISADPEAVAADLNEICRTVGFFQITGHGVADDVAGPAWTMARSFFDLPLADKLSAARNATQRRHASNDYCLVTWGQPSILQEAVRHHVGDLHLMEQVTVPFGKLAWRRRLNNIARLLQEPHVARNLQSNCASRH